MSSEIYTKIASISHDLTIDVFKVSIQFPYRYQSSIGDQIRRACLSISLNIVEGHARRSYKEKVQLNNVAYGSLKESGFLLEFCFELKLVERDFYVRNSSRIDELSRILYSFVYRSQ